MFAEGLYAKVMTLQKKYHTIFFEELGTISPYKAALSVDVNAKPKFFKPRSVPYALKETVGQELDRLEKQECSRGHPTVSGQPQWWPFLKRMVASNYVVITR